MIMRAIERVETAWLRGDGVCGMNVHERAADFSQFGDGHERCKWGMLQGCVLRRGLEEPLAREAMGSFAADKERAGFCGPI